jgi:hypothetical protein
MLLCDHIKEHEVVGHVARVGEKVNAYRVWWGNLKDRNNLRDLDVDGRIILK